MLRLLETLLYRVECRSIISSGIINVVNHGCDPAFVWQTRNYLCHRYRDACVIYRLSLFVTAETARREGERWSFGTSRQLSPHVVGKPPQKCGWRTRSSTDYDPHVQFQHLYGQDHVLISTQPREINSHTVRLSRLCEIVLCSTVHHNRWTILLCVPAGQCIRQPHSQ